MSRVSRSRVALAVAFLVTRLLILALFDPTVHEGDQRHYLRVAQSIFDHGVGGYFDPGFVVERGDYYPYFRGDVEDPDGKYNPIFWDPLYPLFVSGVFAVLGDSPDRVRWAQILISFLTMWVGMDAVRRMFPGQTNAPFVFAWLFVAYLPLAGYTTKIMSETLDTFLLVSLVWVVTGLKRGSLARFVGFGLLLGLYTQIKSYFLWFVPLVVLFVGLLNWWRGHAEPGNDAVAETASLRFLAPRLALIAAATFLALWPTYVRTANLTQGAAVISTKAPWNFWKDNNNFQLVAHDWRQPDVRVHRWLRTYYRTGATALVSPRMYRVYADPNDPNVRPPCDAPLSEMAACERNAAIAWALEDPIRFIRRALAKTANLWSPNNYIFNRAPPGKLAWHQNFRYPLPTWLRWVLQVLVIGLYIAVGVGFFAAIAGPVRSDADRFGRAFVLLGVVFLTFVVVPAGHGVSRFRLPLMVPILMFAALAFARRSALRSEIVAACGAQPLRTACVGLGFLFWAGIVAVKLPLLLTP